MIQCLTRASEQILERLRDDAQKRERSSARLGSIERLAMACNAIESGEAAQIVPALRGNGPINPSNIEKYVKAKFRTGARDWTGPTRVFIAQDLDLKAYVAAREDERVKPLNTRKRPSQRQKDIEDALAQLPIEIRQILRHDLEEGYQTRRRLDVLSKGLRSEFGVDVDALLRGGAGNSRGQDTLSAPQPSAPLASPLTDHDTGVLKAMVGRLQNSEEMKRAGLEFDGRRLRISSGPLTTIVRPEEMALLRRLAGLTDA